MDQSQRKYEMENQEHEKVKYLVQKYQNQKWKEVVHA